ncbi:MAG: immunity 17 family protein [Cyanobacteria bacterium J06642_2]
MESVLPSIFCILAGLFTIAGGVFNWNWFMNSRRARLFVRILSRTGARIFYVLLGLVLVGIGISTLF